MATAEEEYEELDEPELEEEEEVEGDEPLVVSFLNDETGEYEDMTYEEVDRIVRETRKGSSKQQQPAPDISQHVPVMRELATNGVAQFSIEYRRYYPYATDAQIVQAWASVNAPKTPTFETEEERKEWERDQREAERDRKIKEMEYRQQLREIHDNNDEKLIAALNDLGWSGNITEEQSQAILKEWEELYPKVDIKHYPLNAKQARTLITNALGKNTKAKGKEASSQKPRVPSREAIDRLKKAPRAIPGDSSRDTGRGASQRNKKMSNSERENWLLTAG